MRKLLYLYPLLLAAPLLGQDPLSTARRYVVHSDGADWHLQGEGVVCCPCTVPCPCRTNGSPSYGHCEATLYLHIREGHYGTLSFNDLRLVNTSGSCAMSYQRLAAFYFDPSTQPEEREAFLKLMASFFQNGTAEFPHVRILPINAQITDGHLLRVSIPEVMQMAVDRNWGHDDAPLPFVAATDYFSNTIQYVRNLVYRMRDEDANLDFDYSRRQANYREVDLDASHYRTRSMIVQFSDGKGGFNQDQLRLIREQRLALPDLSTIRRELGRLR